MEFTTNSNAFSGWLSYQWLRVFPAFVLRTRNVAKHLWPIQQCDKAFQNTFEFVANFTVESFDFFTFFFHFSNLKFVQTGGGDSWEEIGKMRESRTRVDFARRIQIRIQNPHRMARPIGTLEVRRDVYYFTRISCVRDKDGKDTPAFPNPLCVSPERTAYRPNSCPHTRPPPLPTHHLTSLLDETPTSASR